MYMLSKGPYKIIAKSRRGLTKKLDTLENPSTSSRDIGKRPGDLSVTADMSSPKPIFHQVNGRRTHSQKSHQETITPQHEEIIRYIQDTWKGIYKEYETTKQSNDGKVPNVVYYQDGSSNQHLSNFQPFDLELFWGERLLQNIQQST